MSKEKCVLVNMPRDIDGKLLINMNHRKIVDVKIANNNEILEFQKRGFDAVGEPCTAVRKVTRISGEEVLFPSSFQLMYLYEE